MGATDIWRLFSGRHVLAILVFTIIVALATLVMAEDYSSVQGYVHTFNNNLNVTTGVFALNKDISLDTSAYFKYTVDMINSSTGGGGEDDGGSRVAAVSGASGIAGSGETRNEVMAGFSHNFNNIIGVEAYYDYSHESDYTSNTPLITLKKDLFDKNTTLTLGLSRNMDSINGKFMNGTQNRDTNNYFFGITQLLSPVTIAQIGYSMNDSSGFESEGIRLVPLNGTSTSSCTDRSSACVDERFPNSRKRNAYIFNISRYFVDGYTEAFKKASVKLNLRYYDDSWDIRSYTGEIEYNKHLTDQLVMRLDYRYYTQTKAFFVKDQYTGAEEFLSASPQLLKFNSNLVGAKLTYNFKEEKGFNAIDPSWLRWGSVEGKYEYYTESINVHGHVFMAGLRLLF